MREEPVLYINGQPYVLREAMKPFANLEYTGAFCIISLEIVKRILGKEFMAVPALAGL